MCAPEVSEVAFKLGFLLHVAHSPEARIPCRPGVRDDETTAQYVWESAQYLLRCASALDEICIRFERLDQWDSGGYCETAAEYTEIEEVLVKGFILRQSRFQMIWNVYESVRNTSPIGHFLKSNGKIDLLLESGIHLDGFPYLESFVNRFDCAWAVEESPLNAATMPELFRSEDLKKLSEAGLFCRAGVILNRYRNFLYHGDEKLPEPNDSFDHYGGVPFWRNPIKWERLDTASNLALLMIYIFSMDWLPDFLASTTFEDEHLYLVGLSYASSEPHEIAHELAHQIFSSKQA